MTPPTYDQWLENAIDYDWYTDDLIYYTSEIALKGIEIDPDTVSFDVYRGDITSDGFIRPKTFALNHKELLDISPIQYQLLLEDNFDLKWNGRSRTRLLFDHGNQFYWNDWNDSFQEGIFAGCEIQPLLDSEEGIVGIKFSELMEKIIYAEHQKLLKQLEQTYEYITSEEAYQEWLTYNKES